VRDLEDAVAMAPECTFELANVEENAIPASLPRLEMTFAASDTREEWVERTCDLSGFAGRNLIIRFDGTQAPGASSVFRLDGITLLAAPAPAPEGEAK